MRHRGRFDADGNFYFIFKRFKPYKLPIKQVAAAVEEYERENNSYIMYDPDLGWTIRPGSDSRNGLYKSNSMGLRSAPSEISISRETDTIRIALFGDSYTHADDVPFEESWGALLELELKNMGINAEVINFGVPAYGFDQAYLRWKKMGRQFKPDIVILGFFAYDSLRCVNVFWPIVNPAGGFFFAKPRFVLNGDSLELVNSPVPPPSEVVDLLKNFDDSELANYEYFYDKSDFAHHFWHRSKLLTLVLDVSKQFISGNDLVSHNFFDPEEEPGRVALGIIDRFRKDVEAEGAAFLIVYLPSVNDLASIVKKENLPYAGLLEKIDAEYRVIHPESEMIKSLKNYNVFSLFIATKSPGGIPLFGHYNFAGNKVVAEVTGKYLTGKNSGWALKRPGN